MMRNFPISGRKEEDQETVKAVKELLSLVSSFPEHFDETTWFSGGRQAEVGIFMDYTIIFRYI